ncbi:MAG TPA: hypothetical protein VI699_02445, partial [Candidatus Acidoferrales bacterium]|nr:hypothetical protein [Candidatus Acidoferrales bacterium]
PAIMADQKEEVEDSKRNGVDGEEIHGGDEFSMVLEERLPSIPLLWISWCALHPTRHSPFRGIETERPQFAVNPGRSPRWILGPHAEDEFSQFFARPLSPHSLSVAR